jgi:hypothetical protein
VCHGRVRGARDRTGAPLGTGSFDRYGVGLVGDGSRTAAANHSTAPLPSFDSSAWIFLARQQFSVALRMMSEGLRSVHSRSGGGLDQERDERGRPFHPPAVMPANSDPRSLDEWGFLPRWKKPLTGSFPAIHSGANRLIRPGVVIDAHEPIPLEGRHR